MKKLVVLILFLALIGGAGYLGYNFFFAEDQVDAVVEDDTDNEDTETLPEDDNIEVDEVADEPVIEEDEESLAPDSEEAKDVRLVGQIYSLTSHESHFIKFNHDDRFTIEKETMNGLEIHFNGEVIAVIDVYTNEENLSPSSFVEQKENVIDYYFEAENNNITPEEIYKDEELKAVKFADMPGFIVQDIYLVPIDGYLVVVSVRDQKANIYSTLVTSIEKNL